MMWAKLLGGGLILRIDLGKGEFGGEVDEHGEGSWGYKHMHTHNFDCPRWPETPTR